MRTGLGQRIALYGCGLAAAITLLVVGFAAPEPGVDQLLEPLVALARTDTFAARRGAEALSERFEKSPKPALFVAFISEQERDTQAARRWYTIALNRCTDSVQRAEVLVALADLARRGKAPKDADRLAAEARALAPELARVRAFDVLRLLDNGLCEQALKEARALAEKDMSPMAGRLRSLAEAACRERQEQQPGVDATKVR